MTLKEIPLAAGLAITVAVIVYTVFATLCEVHPQVGFGLGVAFLILLSLFWMTKGMLRSLRGLRKVRNEPKES